MQQPQSQRGRLVSAFNNDFGNKNQVLLYFIQL